MSDSTPSRSGYPDRTSGMGMTLALAKVGGNLTLASAVTIILVAGMTLALVSAIVFIEGSDNPGMGLAIALTITVIFNIAAFFLSPFLMDLSQQWLYGTRWVSLAEIQRHSPETVRVLQRVCADKGIERPRLGIIEDDNPTAFTYGSLPNTARLVVSRGLLKYLDDDEIAAVYAHELGHIVHGDFAVMTVASTLVQICYLIYIYLREFRFGDSDSKDLTQRIAGIAFLFYVIGSYLLLYLSRTREYFADHYAASVTGNPNALSRALVKIAYGIVEEGQRAKEPSRLLQGTRALGIYDHNAATCTGTAYRVTADTTQLGRVFLWDMFNPWAWWMELNSTHPLTGKRVRALSTYAEQLGLRMEFDMGRILNEGRTLSKQRLYGSFFLDILLYSAETLGCLIGLGIGFSTGTGVISLALLGLGIGILLKTWVTYPSLSRAPQTDVLTLMANPYASPLRGKPAQLEGTLIGRGDAGYRFGSDLKLQDKSGLLFLRYSSRFGPVGNFLFGMNQVRSLLNSPVSTLGWFRRGIAPWMDLIQLETPSGTVVNSYHRFWSLILGTGLVLVGLLLGMV